MTLLIPCGPPEKQVLISQQRLLLTGENHRKNPMIDVVTPGRLGAMLKAKFGETVRHTEYGRQSDGCGITGTDSAGSAGSGCRRAARTLNHRFEVHKLQCRGGWFQPGEHMCKWGGSSVLHDKLSKLSGNRGKRKKTRSGCCKC